MADSSALPLFLAAKPYGGCCIDAFARVREPDIISPSVMLVSPSRDVRSWIDLAFTTSNQDEAAVVKRFSLTILWVAFLGVAGCGYSFDRSETFRTTNADKDRIRTVALDIFQSREFRRGLELQLTEALAKRIEAESPFKLAKKGRADTELSGEIQEVRQSTIGRDFALVRPRETAATVIASFQWKDLRTGEVLLDRPRFVQTVDYIRPLGEDFYHAMQRAMDRMAERIVEQMYADDW